MINKKSIEKVDSSVYKEFRIPLYDTYCFSNISETIKRLYSNNINKGLPVDTVGKYTSSNKVIFFLIDAFGWTFYRKYKEKSKFLKQIENKGIVSKITSQFPSTTTAHITTFLSNTPVYEHGLYEWFYYEPECNEIIVPFLFKGAYDNTTGSLKDKGIDEKSFLNDNNIFRELNKLGVKSYIYQKSYINNSIYSNIFCKDGERVDYDNYEDLFSKLICNLNNNNNKEFFYVYLPEIDSKGHEKGSSSKEFKEEIENLFYYLDRFYENLKNINSNVKVMISADHGQVEIDLDKKNYLNEDFPKIYNYLEKNIKGKLMSPGGYCRDLFLKVKEEYLYYVKELLEKKYKDILYVLTYDEVIKYGFFKESSKRLKERCGNLILLPKNKENIWWFEKGVFEINQPGVHGGASKEEMDIPFLFYEKK